MTYFTDSSYGITTREDGSILDAVTGELITPAQLDAEYEAYAEGEIEGAEDLIRAEQANEYAMEGITNY